MAPACYDCSLAFDSRNMANGQRTSPFHILTSHEIASLLEDIHAIRADASVFWFNSGAKTGYIDELDIINIQGDVLPDISSPHPRDRMSARAVLAHEYYGHRSYRGTPLARGSWNDEFRASYMAAKNCPNLTHEDCVYLIQDAIMRAQEAGITIHNNHFMNEVLYGR